MAMNIEDEGAHVSAKEASEAPRRADIVHRLVAEFDAGLDDEAREALRQGTASLYDEDGLPVEAAATPPAGN